MANKNRDVERGAEPADTDPIRSSDDRVEQVRGTADDDADEFEDSDDEEIDEDEEQEEGTF
jgi:hypothetical protein